MTLSTSTHPRRTLRPRAGSAVTGIFLGGLVISGAFAALVGPVGGRPAVAAPVADQNDQPTPATVPSRTEGKAAERTTGTVSSPSAIKSSTSVISSGTKGSTTNPLDHLPARDRAATGGRGE